MRYALVTLAAAAALIAAGCGEDGSTYDRQYPAPTNESDMMRVLRTHTVSPPPPRP